MLTGVIIPAVTAMNGGNVMLKCATSRKVAQDRRGTHVSMRHYISADRAFGLLCFGIVFLLQFMGVVDFAAFNASSSGSAYQEAAVR